MKKIYSTLKWILLIIWSFLIFAFMEVPGVESTPLYSVKNKREFYLAFHQVNLQHNILMFIAFTIITFVMEWYLCKWVGNKLNFMKKVTLKNLILAIISGLIAYGIGILSAIIAHGSGTNNIIFTETLKTNLAILVILDLVVIGPIFEEILFQAAIQKGFFKRLPPWASIIITSVIFAIAHNAYINIFFFQKVLSGIIFGSVYQKTDDIKMAILTHGINNLIIVSSMAIQAYF